MIKHSKSNWIQKRFIKTAEKNILLLKVILTLKPLLINSFILRYLIHEISLTFKRFNSRSRTRSVCILTGRTIGVYRKNFRVNRMQVKEKSLQGYFPGIRKSSW